MENWRSIVEQVVDMQKDELVKIRKDLQMTRQENEALKLVNEILTDQLDNKTTHLIRKPKDFEELPSDIDVDDDFPAETELYLGDKELAKMSRLLQVACQENEALKLVNEILRNKQDVKEQASHEKVDCCRATAERHVDASILFVKWNINLILIYFDITLLFHIMLE